MNGHGAIVVNIRDGKANGFHDFAEHSFAHDAKREAERLCGVHGGTFVVYVPVAIFTPPPKVVETKPAILSNEQDEDLPF
jgi:hypothetical protein